MAQTGQKDLIARLADAGEEAIQRLAGTPGASSVLGVVTNMRDQMDALAKRVRGMDALERRIENLERELARLQRSGASSTTRRTASSAKTAASSTRKTAASARKTAAKTASSAAKTGTSRKTSTRKR